MGFFVRGRAAVGRTKASPRQRRASRHDSRRRCDRWTWSPKPRGLNHDHRSGYWPDKERVEIPQRSRGAGACRRLAKLMTELGWTAVRVRGLTRGGYRAQVRGYCPNGTYGHAISAHQLSRRTRLSIWLAAIRQIPRR